MNEGGVYYSHQGEIHGVLSVGVLFGNLTPKQYNKHFS